MTGYLLLDRPNPHGNHFYTSRRIPMSDVRLGVVHTGENLPDFEGDDSSGESLSSYARTTSRSVSWHTTVDSDSTIKLLPDTHLAWHARNYNTPSVGMEQATRAAMWDDAPADWVEGIITQAATEVARWHDELKIGIRQLTMNEVLDRKRGLVAHATLDPGRRSDPGRDYPWTMLLDMATTIVRGGTIAQPSPPDPKPTPRPGQREPLLRLGDRGNAVREWQRRLMQWNRESLRQFGADGVFGGETHEATRLFQKRRKITDDGIVGPQTRKQMDQYEQGVGSGVVRFDLPAYNGPMLTQPPVMYHRDVRLWQRALNHWTPNALKVDGAYGPISERVTRVYQRQSALTVDGKVGPKTWGAMRSDLRS